MLVAGFVEIKNARVKKFSNIRENLLHILSGMQVLTALVLIENIPVSYTHLDVYKRQVY